MLKYAVKRVLQIIPSMLILSLLAFYAIHAMPGMNSLGIRFTGENATHIRYIQYMSNMLRGNFGISMKIGRPVLDELLMRFPYTLGLAFGGIFVAGLLGVLLGIVSAANHNKRLDNVIMVVSLITASMPLFFLAVMLMLFFCVYLGWLPSRGMSSFKSSILPVLTMGLPAVGYIARITRSSMLEVIRQDYISAATARGIPQTVVIYAHAFRNTIMPVMTAVGVRFGELLAGTVLVENAFSIPGMGRLIIDSVIYRDYSMLYAGIISLAFVFLVINIIIDLLYIIADPKVSYAKKTG